MKDNLIEPLDIEFDDLLTPQPVREEPAKEEPTKEIEPTAKINLADIEDSETEDADEDIESPLRLISKEEDTDTEEHSTVVSEILEKFGYELDEEFEDTTEGLTKLTQAISEKLAVETLDSLFERFPTVQKHLEYVQQGGDPNDFMKAFTPETDYSRLEIQEDDISLQKRILTDYFVARGTERDFIGDMLESYEDKGTLRSKAEAAKKALSDAQSFQREAALEEQKRVNTEKQAQTRRMWENVSTIISEADNLSGIPISQRDKGKFFDYISKPINSTGATQRDIDFQQAGMDQKLAVDFLMFKGFDINKYIGKRATTQAAETLRTKLEGHSKKAKSVGARLNSFNNGFESLDFDVNNLGG